MAEIDDSGAQEKFESLRQLNRFFENIHIAAAQFYRSKIVNEVINGQLVNVISGNLRRSHTAKKISKFRSVVRVNVDVRLAPYQPKVEAYTVRRYGQSYVAYSKDRFLERTIQIAEDEYREALKLIKQGQKYEYKNPYPAR